MFSFSIKFYVVHNQTSLYFTFLHEMNYHSQDKKKKKRKRKKCPKKGYIIFHPKISKSPFSLHPSQLPLARRLRVKVFVHPLHLPSDGDYPIHIPKLGMLTFYPHCYQYLCQTRRICPTHSCRIFLLQPLKDISRQQFTLFPTFSAAHYRNAKRLPQVPDDRTSCYFAAIPSLPLW